MPVMMGGPTVRQLCQQRNKKILKMNSTVHTGFRCRFTTSSIQGTLRVFLEVILAEATI